MKAGRTISHALGLLAAAAATAGCARAGHAPAQQEHFVEELAEMVFGDRRIVELAVGYPIVQASIIDGLDRGGRAPAGTFDPALHVETLSQLDAAYTQFVFDVRPRPVNAGRIRDGSPAERVQLAYRGAFATVQADRSGGSPARNASALAFVSHASPAPGPQVEAAAAELHGGRRAAREQVRPGCALFQSAEPATGYVDTVVATVADPAGMLDLSTDDVFLCVFSAHIFNIGFSDAVRSGRFAAFPVDRTRACKGEQAASADALRADPCRLLIRRRAHFAVAAELVRTGRLRPGRQEREAFVQAAREAVERIGWPTLAAIQDFEAQSKRQLNPDRGPPPVVRQ